MHVRTYVHTHATAMHAHITTFSLPTLPLSAHSQLLQVSRPVASSVFCLCDLGLTRCSNTHTHAQNTDTHTYTQGHMHTHGRTQDIIYNDWLYEGIPLAGLRTHIRTYVPGTVTGLSSDFVNQEGTQGYKG